MVANSAPLERRDRALVTIAGIAPDLDGLGAPVEMLTKNSEHPLLWFSEYHHLLCHNLLSALIYAGVAAAFGMKRRLCALLAFVTFNLHLLCDIVGARGPDGHQWPIWYFGPFSRAWPLTWSGQWRLDSWINQALTAVLLAITFFLAWRRGYSPLDLVSKRADEGFVAVLRKRFRRAEGEDR
jgi:inner membrane protein